MIREFEMEIRLRKNRRVLEESKDRLSARIINHGPGTVVLVYGQPSDSEAQRVPLGPGQQYRLNPGYSGQLYVAPRNPTSLKIFEELTESETLEVLK